MNSIFGQGGLLGGGILQGMQGHGTPQGSPMGNAMSRFFQPASGQPAPGQPMNITPNTPQPGQRGFYNPLLGFGLGMMQGGAGGQGWGTGISNGLHYGQEMRQTDQMDLLRQILQQHRYGPQADPNSGPTGVY